MPTGESSVPVLSTPQDNSVFTYAKAKKPETNKSHLQLNEGQDYVSKIRDYYSLEELALFLNQTEEGIDGNFVRKFTNVTLQFPDMLICDSSMIVQELQKLFKSNSANFATKEYHEKSNENKMCKSGYSNVCFTREYFTNSPTDSQRLWILADTSYSACCVDEVAAQHVNADLVVHFGDACLNPVSCLPSAYVFGKPRLNLNVLAEKFRGRYPYDSYKSQRIVLMADAPHTHLLKELAQKLPEYKIFRTELYLADKKNSHIIGLQSQACDTNELKALGRIYKNMAVDENNDDILRDCELFQIGLPEAPRLLQLTTKFLSVTTFQNNEVSQGPYPNLMRRYRYMHMAKAAGTLGILVNTLSLANSKDLMNSLVKKIKDAGKKHYIFVVGKPNVAKLANFEAIDMWCVLGCNHQGIIIDQTSEYFKPIITPYELLLSIGDEFSWTGKWITDFRNVLSEIGDDAEEYKDESDQKEIIYNGNESDEEPEFDSVTGKYTSSAKPLRRLQHLRLSMIDERKSEEKIKNENHGDLVQKSMGTVAFRDTVSTSAAYLQTRQWTGLGSDWTTDIEEDGASMEEGTSGIARGYGFDVVNQGP